MTLAAYSWHSHSPNGGRVAGRDCQSNFLNQRKGGTLAAQLFNGPSPRAA